MNQYKTKCNPSNKRLVKVTNQCDAKAKKYDTHAHGGYVCGDDGEWTSDCVIAHCDLGYHFDKSKNICIENKCVEIPQETSEQNENDEKDNEKIYMSLMIVFICISIVLIIMVVILLVIVNKLMIKLKAKGDYNELN